MEIISLGSGSSGNCTIIKSKGHIIMVDAGINKKLFSEKLAAINVTLDDIEAVFFTHDHIDHIRLVDLLPLDIRYAGLGTVELLGMSHWMTPYQTKEIAGFKVTPFPLSHDATNALGYIIDDGEEKLVYLTDTGYVNRNNFKYLKNADIYLFESNYDVEMLMNSKRPYFLIQRIYGDKGHLSNEQAGMYLSKLIGDKTKEIMLIHLSEDTNTPEIALNTINNILYDKNIDMSKIKLHYAYRYEITKGGMLKNEV